MIDKSVYADNSKELVIGSDGVEYYIEYDKSNSGLKLISEVINRGEQSLNEIRVETETTYQNEELSDSKKLNSIENEDFLDPDDIDTLDHIENTETMPSVSNDEYLDPDVVL